MTIRKFIEYLVALPDADKDKWLVLPAQTLHGITIRLDVGGVEESGPTRMEIVAGIDPNGYPDPLAAGLPDV